MSHASSPAQPRSEPLLNDIIRRRLGARLRENYAEIEGEPLPDDHVDLLLRLRHKERERQPKRA